MGLYSQGNAFSRKVVNRKVLALILNFSTVGHGGGVWGGVWIILAYEPEGSTSILWKRHIFKAVGGAIMGGRLLGCFNGGATFGIHGGAQGGRSIRLWSIFYLEKCDIFIWTFV